MIRRTLLGLSLVGLTVSLALWLLSNHVYGMLTGRSMMIVLQDSRITFRTNPRSVWVPTASGSMQSWPPKTQPRLTAQSAPRRQVPREGFTIAYDNIILPDPVPKRVQPIPRPRIVSKSMHLRWPSIVFAVIASTLWCVGFRQRRMTRKRARMGLCLTCGYDLQCSPACCPECGQDAN